MPHVRILVVEDESITAADLAQRLESLGYEVLANVPTGEQAVTLAGEWKPDLVLMDVRLRGAMDGTDAANRIRHDYHLPVVYLTAHSDRATLNRAKATEPEGFLIKPFGDRELESIIEMALAKHRAEVRLRESEERFRALSEATFEGVVMHRNGIAIEVNPSFLEMLGYTREEIVGRHVIDLVIAPESFDHIAERIAVGDSGPYEAIVCRKDGTRFPAEIRAKDVDYQGQRVRVASLRDLTTIKELTRALDGWKAEVERMRPNPAGPPAGQ
ncbi:MAG TPA: PAS domain S-box protein [Verrucomicrobiae bacterium]